MNPMRKKTADIHMISRRRGKRPRVWVRSRTALGRSQGWHNEDGEQRPTDEKDGRGREDAGASRQRLML